MKINPIIHSTFVIRALFLSLIIFFFGNTAINAQDDFLKELLNTADILNETLLEVTALSDEEENSIGIELEKQILNDLRVVKEKKFNLKKIFKDIMRYVDRTNINYGYKVVETDEVNAYAIAGGRMFFNTGILEFLETEDEIAFVMAHEISHNELRHCIKRVQYAAIASSVDPSFGEIVQLAYGIYSMPFTKYDEYEADELGVWLMKKAGYDKQGAVDFFTKLEELEKEYGMDQRDAVNDFISSHPTARERRDRVKKL
jgi:predicted Zn-dependent protease